MAVRSRRIAGPTSVGPGSALMFTVPAGRTLIVKGYSLVNHSGAVSRAYWSVNGTGQNQQFNNTANIAAGDGVQAVLGAGGWTLNPGDTLHLTVTGGTVVAMLWGALLDGAPQ